MYHQASQGAHVDWRTPPRLEVAEMRLPGLWPDTRSAAAPDDTPDEEAVAPSPMRMPTLLERLRVIVVQLLQYDGPLESRAEICHSGRSCMRWTRPWRLE
eukprot:COSAG04_NODE_1465_length_6606_cov_59.955279_2_plen_100_part_00